MLPQDEIGRREEIARIMPLGGKGSDLLVERFSAAMEPRMCSLLRDHPTSPGGHRPSRTDRRGTGHLRRPGTYGPTYGDTQDPNNPAGFKLTTDSAGLAIWAGFDHGTILDPSFARMGMIDYYRLPKQCRCLCGASSS